MAYRQAMRHDQIALQLYTVRELLARDPAGTLRTVADAGYHSVELAGLPDVPPDELARLLETSGLRAISSHQGIDGLRADPIAVADRLRTLDCPTAIVPSMREGRPTIDSVRRFAAELGEVATTLADRELRLGYHNHDVEFRPIDGGTTAWDVLLEELPPEVELELDVYWAVVAGRDPVELIRATTGRVRMLHMKDRAAGPEPHDAPGGTGILDFPAIVEAGRAAGVEWYISEQDDPGDALADIAQSARYLASLAT
jgi:sugar phosphate isomerase/epimerase